jgi:hypothetical protein
MEETDMTKVTAENIEEVRESMRAIDQRDELVVGCETWNVSDGWMTRWPSGRGAVAWGGDSSWGDWLNDILTLDDPDADGYPIEVTSNGEER